MDFPKNVDAKGILNPHIAGQKFQLTRYTPSPDLAYFVEWYWIIHWDLRGQEPHTQDVLPYPSVNFAVEANQSGVFGVVTGKFTRTLVNSGRVVAAKFRPAGFIPFVQSPISQFTNKVTPIISVFGNQGDALERSILATEQDADALAQMEYFLHERMPQRDPNIAVVNEMIDCIIQDRTITRVDELVKHISMNKRALQRLFNQYVGISPKWVIQRYRLQDAADQLIKDEATDCTDMALRLGYFDLAHFIKDFKTIVGLPPAEYARRASLSS
jgi:AraC-like DNA-binding protein